MDTNNPVVQLCMEGMQAEGEGKPERARDLFMQAWEAARDDFDACVAAHYLARHQESPEETLRWNQESLNRAEAVADERVGGFYPSLYLNMGWSYEQLGDYAEARRYYTLSCERFGSLGDDRYGDIVRQGAEGGLKRLDAAEGSISD